jgi:4'-phosphopantetheinyl transferase
LLFIHHFILFMPLLIKMSIEPEGVVGVWHNVEGDDYFRSKLTLFPIEIEELSVLNGRKRSEWLCSRYLLHLLSGRHDRGACLKDNYGKPYLEGSAYQISISHSSDYTAIAAAPVEIGVDIQTVVEKIARIQSKFVTPLEGEYIDPAHSLLSLHTIWGAKEAMYKAYGKRELDFRGHIFVGPFLYNKDGFKWNGEIRKGDFYEKYDLFCHSIHHLILVYAIQNH